MNIKKSQNINVFLYCLIILVNTYKIILINSGFLTEPDERRYLMSWRLLNKLLHGDFTTAIQAVFSANGRPGSIILHTIPAGFQFITAKIFGLELLESQNAAPVFLYNFFINILILFFLYKILKYLYQDKTIALFGVLFYSVLVNNFSYLRHIYPYNEALLIFLYLIYRLLKQHYQNYKLLLSKAFLFGMISFGGILIYPAYYLSFLAVYLFFNFLLIKQKIEINQIIKLNLGYITGSLLLLFATEFLSRLGHHSYINNVILLSKTVTQGSFNETYIFIFKYLWQVEHWTGLLLIIGLTTAGIMVFKTKKCKTDNKYLIFSIFISFLIPYLYYVSNGYFGHKVVMYGRILHQFIIPAIVISLWPLDLIKKQKRKFIIIALSLLISIQFYFQIQNYLQIGYPRDVYWHYLKNYPRSQIKEITEYKNAWSNLPQKLDSIYINHDKKDTITIVNGQYFYPVNSYKLYKKYSPEKNKTLIYQKPHFINYKAYQFEGYDQKARNILDSLQLKIKIYKQS